MAFKVATLPSRIHSRAFPDNEEATPHKVQAPAGSLLGQPDPSLLPTQVQRGFQKEPLGCSCPLRVTFVDGATDVHHVCRHHQPPLVPTGTANTATMSQHRVSHHPLLLPAPHGSLDVSSTAHI